MDTSEDLRASIGGIFLALLLNANIANCQESRVAVNAAEPTATDGVLRITNYDVVTIAEFNDAFEGFAVGQAKQPE